MTYKYMSLSKIKEKEPEMRRLKVSQVARSPRGFLTQYKRVGGNPAKLSDGWQKKRNGFIARTLPSYRNNPTYRRKLSLIAWGFNP